MDKRLSIDTIQQQLAETENLREAQLNRLLERLESQKAKLPLEDRSIIDWGINTIRIRLRQREQLMDEVREKLKNMCTNLINEWEVKPNPGEVYSLLNIKLPEIMGEGVDLEYAEGSGESIFQLMGALQDLDKRKKLNDNQGKSSLTQICQNTRCFCSGKAKELHDKIKNGKIEESELETASNLAKHYKLAAEDFSLSATKQQPATTD